MIMHHSPGSSWLSLVPWRRRWLRGFHAWAHVQLMAVPLGDFANEGYWYGVRLAGLLASDSTHWRQICRNRRGPTQLLGDYNSIDQAFLLNWVHDDRALAGYLDGAALVHRVTEARTKPTEGYGDFLARPWPPTFDGLFWTSPEWAPRGAHS